MQIEIIEIMPSPTQTKAWKIDFLILAKEVGIGPGTKRSKSQVQ